ncbi:acid phosphatase [Bordetella pertussis]|uniref:PAP2 family protein n=3 Tax=Bordetella TaxID=517 RepID=A0ABR4RM80_BORBO|nr:acid phosphatase [Bordetella pertussis]ETH42826.1 PAP2 family protein [Bordetella pertussis H939]ETH50159.1 PAP2 family protein [Bordetella pertussis H973]ETH55073.1 PAP2 family protein [Bordetella pertussis I002]ETH57989.1 PAP2 family protein [Bordetella pertussis I036]ETH68526.1 PAP2 family protein [Bordetella pertussis STO1-CHLA-0006]ETH71886.1 PAP2 family protein [Bordetella pertussis STO1-CHLA-0011]ETH85605.1 PAP2 family protein [Bordetella pertussis STO1-CHOC-0018]ETH90347.1 PAP2 f
MESYAVWIAAHPIIIFVAAPVLAAAGALLLWQLVAGLPAGRRRTMVFAVLALVAVGVFGALAASVEHQGGMVAFDQALARALGLSMPAALLWVLSWFTHLGDRTLLTLVAVGMTLTLLWRRRWVLAGACVAATGGAGALNWLLKRAFQRVRPDHLHGYTLADGWSFPSGHASASMAVYGIACYLMLRTLPARWRSSALAGVAALIVAIGVSRVLLQVHFLSDVVAGFAITAAWLALCVAVTEWALRVNARA